MQPHLMLFIPVKKLFLLTTFAFIFGIILSPSKTFATNNEPLGNLSSISYQIINDYQGFYSFDRLSRLGIGFGLGAVIANTSIDQNIQDNYQQDIRSTSTDDWAKTAKKLGESKYLLPLSVLSAGIHFFDDASSVGNWGMHATRAYIVGVPAVALMQRVTGASRPGEKSHQSDWKPFEDSNGVSGHAFVGAVPFLTIAKMNDNNPIIKYAAYAASFASSWSRINDNAHYFSQAALGWYMAFESVDSVFDADKRNNNISFAPMFLKDGYGLSAQIHY